MSNKQPPKNWEERLIQEQAKQKELLAKTELPADVQGMKYPIKWEYKGHSYSIGDTGDYDGYWEITNGKDSLITKEDYDDIEKDLQAVVDLLNNTYANFTVDRGNEAALDAENKFLREELKKAQPGAMWVKASERLPEKDGLICFKICGGYMNAYITTRKSGYRCICDNNRQLIKNWKDAEWLDESGAAANELEQLRQWKIEAVEMQIPIIAYAHKHLEAKIGDSCTALVIAELDRLRTENAALKADGDNLSRPARSLRLSVTAHPDYTGEENEDEAIKEWSGEKEVKGE